jgi:hypothetical protein
MNFQKLIIGALLGAVLYYLLGWLVYQNLLQAYFNQNTGKAGHAVFRTEHLQLYRWAGFLCQGALLSLVIQWSGSRTVVKGLLTGGLLGLLMEMGFDCQTYATTFVISKHGMLGNVLAFSAISAVAGAAVAWMSGGGRQQGS